MPHSESGPIIGTVVMTYGMLFIKLLGPDRWICWIAFAWKSNTALPTAIFSSSRRSRLELANGMEDASVSCMPKKGFEEYGGTNPLR